MIQEKPKELIRQEEIIKELTTLQREFKQLTGDKWHEKIVKCKTCKRHFTSQAEYEYTENGDRFADWTAECQLCEFKLSDKYIEDIKEIVNSVRCYKEGLMTKEELIKRLKI